MRKDEHDIVYPQTLDSTGNSTRDYELCHWADESAEDSVLLHSKIRRWSEFRITIVSREHAQRDDWTVVHHIDFTIRDISFILIDAKTTWDVKNDETLRDWTWRDEKTLIYHSLSSTLLQSSWLGWKKKSLKNLPNTRHVLHISNLSVPSTSFLV